LNDSEKFFWQGGEVLDLGENLQIELEVNDKWKLIRRSMQLTRLTSLHRHQISIKLTFSNFNNHSSVFFVANLLENVEPAPERREFNHYP
jgi:hypothetical protein